MNLAVKGHSCAIAPPAAHLAQLKTPAGIELFRLGKPAARMMTSAADLRLLLRLRQAVLGSSRLGFARCQAGEVLGRVTPTETGAAARAGRRPRQSICQQLQQACLGAPASEAIVFCQTSAGERLITEKVACLTNAYGIN